MDGAGPARGVRGRRRRPAQSHLPHAPAKPAPAARNTRNRIAWLLRVNRIFGPDPQWSRTAAFVRAFRGGCWSGAASESTVSRWETGLIPVPYLAVRRYEELLGLHPGLLVSVIDTLNRYGAPTVRCRPELDRGDSPPDGLARVEDLLDRVHSGAPMSGWQWDELTGLLCGYRELVLVPRTAWSQLAGRLLLETIVADGVPWVQRFEALCRLLAHPTGQAAAVAAVTDLVLDRSNLIFVEPVSALDASPHPDAGRFVLSQLTDPLNDRARYGALLACVRKVKYGHLNPDQLVALAPLLADLLDGPDTTDDLRRLAAGLLRRLPAPVRAPVEGRLRQALAADRGLAAVLEAGRTGTEQTGRIVVTRIAEQVPGPLVPRGTRNRFHDDMLPVLLDEMLYSPVMDVRLYAAMLIYATPYRAAAAATLGAELARAVTGTDVDLCDAILGGLRFLGGAAQRPLVERLITAPGLAPRVTTAAAHHIGHIGGYSDAQFWHTVLRHHGQRWQRHRDPVSASVLSGVVYGLGIARDRTMLTVVRHDDLVPEPVRAGAAWWLSLPKPIWLSAHT